MPFKSDRQRRWMYANLPELAEQWTRKYHPKRHVVVTTTDKTPRPEMGVSPKGPKPQQKG